MRAFLFIAFVLATTILHAQGPDKLEADHGILGYKLGQPRDSMPDKVVKVGKVQGLKKYRPANDTIFWRGIKVESLRLHFWRDSLHSIIMKVTEGRNADRVKDYMEQLYGTAEKLDQFGTKFFWRSENVIVNMEENMLSGNSIVSFYHKGLVNRLERYLYDKRYGKD